MENSITITGREKEKEELQEALTSNEAELISVIGRRRVGKTFLIETIYQSRIIFQLTGIQKEPLFTQLRNFRDVIAEYSNSHLPIEQPKDWLAAFQVLKAYLKPLLGVEKKVLFFDELPWISTHKSGFLSAFGYFWNSWAKRQNLVIVICGSAASWMIQKVVNDTGGLHNRITKRLDLQAFTLEETKRYLENRSLFFDHYQLLQIYMATGGIPHYLKAIRKAKSAAQIIDEMCFSSTGLLRTEFPNLYASLFKNHERHIAVIRALATKKQGMTRKEILAKTKTVSGGGVSKVLTELSHSGFITDYFPFGKKHNPKVYRLTDEYSLFYLQFLENKKHAREGTWQTLSQTQAYKTWSGYAFENICLKHIPQIKKALGISRVYTLASTFYQAGKKGQKGAQIDLVLDRNDHVINLFEIKFYSDQFTLTKAYAEAIRQKQTVFKNSSKTRKQIFWVLLTTF
ncbi:MAG: AAA family ATPase, partial [Chitinophagales bacterium]